MHIGWLWLWYAHVWLNIYPCTPTIDLPNAGLHSFIKVLRKYVVASPSIPEAG